MTGPWTEPVRGSYPPPGALRLSGRERLEVWLRAGGPQPPLTHLTGARLTRIGDGTAEAEMPASPWLANSAGLVAGGTLAILADVVLGFSVESKLPPATPYTTAELSLTFLRPASPGTMLTAHGQAIHVGRSVGLSEAFVLDAEDDRLIAHGTSRLAVLPAIDDLPELPGEVSGDVAPPARGHPDPFERPGPDGGVISQAVWDASPGREVLERQIAGELPAPPICALIGASLDSVGDGEAEMSVPATEWLNSPARRLQGGVIAMLADAAMLSAALSTAPAASAVAGLDLKVNFLRPVAGDGRRLNARAGVVHGGRTLAITRGRVDGAEGKPVALATGSAMHLPGRPATLGADTELAGP